MASYTSKVIAVLGRTVRAGRWKVAEDSLVIALFGKCVLDLRRAYVDDDDDELTMTIFAFFGSVSIDLPPGCDVEPSGVAIIASTEVEIPSERPADITRTSLAPLDLSWVAVFGRVRIAEAAPDASPREAFTGFGPDHDAVLPAPAVEVFDVGAEPLPADQPDPDDEDDTRVETVEAFADPEAEAASLRDEIARWRAESGRTNSTEADTDPVDPDEEILSEPDTEPATDSIDDDETVPADVAT